MTKKYVIISKDGEMKIEAHGFVGKECEEKMEFLVRALGDEIASELKAEYHMDEETEEVCHKLKPFCG
jgi:hypothetical protein